MHGLKKVNFSIGSSGELGSSCCTYVFNEIGGPVISGTGRSLFTRFLRDFALRRLENLTPLFEFTR